MSTASDEAQRPPAVADAREVDERGAGQMAGQMAGQTEAPQGDVADGYLRIEQVAARTGMTKRTLRYYEELELLPPTTRTEGGYRLYAVRDVERLERIKRLRDLLGVSLAEIRDMVQAEEERAQAKEVFTHETDPRARLASLDQLEAIARRQLQLVEEKLAGLNEMRANLLERLAHQQARRAELRALLEDDGAEGE